MVYNVTLTVGKGFEGQLPYLENDFCGLTLIFGIPFVGVGGSWLYQGFWSTGSALENLVKLDILSGAERVGALKIGQLLPSVGVDMGWFSVFQNGKCGRATDGRFLKRD